MAPGSFVSNSYVVKFMGPGKIENKHAWLKLCYKLVVQAFDPKTWDAEVGECLEFKASRVSTENSRPAGPAWWDFV